MRNKITLFILVSIAYVAGLSQAFGQTYNEDIAPIIYIKCATCHRSGEIGPMSLTNYSEVKNHSSTIKYVTGTKYMPPWKPDPSFRHFLGENFLSDQEIDLIAKWVDAGSPEGTGEAPMFPDFPDGSVLGEPDLVLSFSEAYLHKGNNRDEYRYFVLPTGLSEDKILKAIELRPGNPQIVHHALFFEDLSGQAAKNDALTPEYGFDGFGGFAGDDLESILTQKQYPGYVPGQKPIFYPEGLGQTIGAGSDLVIQMHYAPWPTDQTDLTTVNIFFADEEEEIERSVDTHIMVPLPSVVNDLFIITKNTVKQFHGVWTIPEDISMIGITPHMHLLGQDWKVYLENTSGDSINLIKIPEWDFNWQGGYFFDRLIVAEKGSKVHAIATYDNTAENPSNPSNPPRTVSWGENTTDEMYYLPIAYIPYRDGDEEIIFADLTSSTDDLALATSTIELISPNPGNGLVNVKFNVTHGEQLSIAITDINGAKIKTIRTQEFYNNGDHVVHFNSDTLNPGIYLITIQGKNQSITKKFIKQ